MIDKQPLLSISIICFNEDRIIKKTLSAIGNLADEVVVVDSFSEDHTPDIVRSFKVNFCQKKWEGYSEQKNCALARCKGKWVLSLDADEIITPELKEEIKKIIDLNTDCAGFKIPRKFFIGQKWVRFGGYYPDYQLRLFKNNHGAEFAKREVHESIKMEGKTGYLRNPIEHYAYQDLADYQNALSKYSILASKEIVKNKKLKFYFPAIRAAWSFTFRYFFRLGFLDGKLGFDLAKSYSKYVYDKYQLAFANSH